MSLISAGSISLDSALKMITYTSVADPDPGSGAFLTLDPGSRIDFFRISDPGSQINIFESLMKIFWVKRSKIL
jgi:hypothetical protein